MINYLLQDSEEEKAIVKIETKTFYTFSPKENTAKEVKSITIYDEEKITKILTRKAMIKYQKLLDLIHKTFAEDDNTEEGMQLCLDEIIRLKDLLENKYQRYLKRELYAKFLEDLTNLYGYVEHKIDKKKRGR